MIALTANDEKSNEEKKSNDFSMVIHTFPRPLFIQK